MNPFHYYPDIPFALDFSKIIGAWREERIIGYMALHKQDEIVLIISAGSFGNPSEIRLPLSTSPTVFPMDQKHLWGKRVWEDIQNYLQEKSTH